MLNQILLRSQPANLPEGDDNFATEVLAGLSSSQKRLPCRFFYDDLGSRLFEEITKLPEYYPTRTEAAILNAHAPEMVEDIAQGDVLVEFGSGSSLKTEILLEQLPQLGAYVSIDVSPSALREAAHRLSRRFLNLDVRPITADFSYPVALPDDLANCSKTGFFPGSTIGNLTPVEAQRLLRVFRAMLSPGGRLIVGVDLKKDMRTLVSAYADSSGITAAFNLNLLARINRELGANFDLQAFDHMALYNQVHGRIEMHLVSLIDQDVVIRGRRFHFGIGDSIHTENSYKYSVGQFRDMARAAGWLPRRVWTDRNTLFSVHELVAV
jgi:dimethylhistidine N-methyltransferase